MIYNYINNISLNNSLINENINQDLNDVVITIDNEELNKLHTFKLDDNLDDICTICMNNYIKNDTLMELPCKHSFHCDCIKTYLNKYNYKCPICRNDVGKHKYNI